MPWKKTRLALAIISTLGEEIAIALFILLGLPRLGVKLPLGALAGIMSGLGTYAVISYRLGSRALLKKPLGGLTDMTGSRGTVLEALSPKGAIKINGELWEAESVNGRIKVGEIVVVVKQSGLRLLVNRAEASPPGD